MSGLKQTKQTDKSPLLDNSTAVGWPWGRIGPVAISAPWGCVQLGENVLKSFQTEYSLSLSNARKKIQINESMFVLQLVLLRCALMSTTPT